jgi:hypothetical protein
VEASHGAMELRASDFCVLLCLNKSFLGELGLSEKRLVDHVV